MTDRKIAISCDIIITGSKNWFLFLFCFIFLLDILLQHPLKVKVSVRMFSILLIFLLIEGDMHAYIMLAFKQTSSFFLPLISIVTKYSS